MGQTLLYMMRNDVLRGTCRAIFAGLQVLLVFTANSKDWYAAPDGRPDGNGTSSNPWSLNSALSQKALVQPGDTVLLRGGEYKSPPILSTLSGTANNYVVVKSYPGEWAVITDGAHGTLLTPLQPATAYSHTFDVNIANSEAWSLGTVIVVDSEHIQLLSRQASLTNWQIARGWNGTQPASHAPGTQVTPRGDIIDHSGNFVVFRDFEITSSDPSDRVVNSTKNLGAGLNLNAAGKGNKAVNLVIHNVGHPGIGFWQQGDGGEINGCLLWGNGIYDKDGVWTRGSGVYAQNSEGMATIKNCVIFKNLTFGAKVFGESGPVKNFQFLSNLAFANGDFHQLECASGSTPTSNVWFVANKVLGRLMLSYVSLSNSHQYVINNIIVGGSLQTKEHVASVYTNNTIFNVKNTVVSELTTAANGYSSRLSSIGNLGITWDHNTWYIGDGSSRNAWHFETTDVPPGWRYWPQWQAASGFDLHSTCATNWPNNYLHVSVQPYDYEPDRWNVCVVSTSKQPSIPFNLSACGFATGESYQLVDAQNWPVVVASGTYSGQDIELPLDLTQTSLIPGVASTVDTAHTNVKSPGLFNVFVLRKVHPRKPLPASRLGVVQ